MERANWPNLSIVELPFSVMILYFAACSASLEPPVELMIYLFGDSGAGGTMFPALSESPPEDDEFDPDIFSPRHCRGGGGGGGGGERGMDENYIKPAVYSGSFNSLYSYTIYLNFIISSSE